MLALSGNVFFFLLSPKFVYKMNRFAIIILLLTIVSCGSQRQLQKAFIGKTQPFLEEKFGAPKTILEHENEKIFVFEKTEELRSTEIKQGKLTLDPIVTPMVKKTERYYFTIKEGKVIKAKLEEEYER